MKTIQFFALFAALVCATSLSAVTLQSLVMNKHKDGDVIVVPNGTYEPSNLINETRHLTFRAETDGGVIIDGGNTARCIDLSDTITLEGFVLQSGKADQGGGVRGGTIIRTTVQNCSATFGGGSYKTHARASIYKGNSAAFFGMAAYGGSVFSCRVEGNTSSAYGGGMGALFGVTVANTSVTGNTALRDNAGVLASPAQNLVYFGNVAERGLYEGAPMNSANALGSEVENAVSVAEEDIFNDAAAGDYSLNVNKATTLIKDKGDTALGGNYDTLWYDTDLAGRPRMLGQSIDLGPYEIADTFTVTCKVVGVGSVTISPNVIQEGDPVTLTATADATYPRNFIGFYVNGELVSTKTTCTYKPVKSDAIEARFAGLSATTANLSTVLGQLHPTIREEVTLADGAYTISGLTKAVAFVGTSIENTTITLSDDCQGSFFINATVTGKASNATLHRSLASGLSGENLTLTSSVIASNCGAMTGTAVNVTAYTTMPAGLTATDCVTLNATTNTVAGAILPKGNANIDAGQGSAVTPYDNLDIAGRPRVIGRAIDCGAHECHYITLTVEASGYYTALTPAVGTYDVLTGDVMTLSGTSPRTFEGWTLANGTLVSADLNATYVVPEMNATLKATFAGFELQPGDTLPEGTTAADTIILAAGTYENVTWDTSAKIVGTGKQNEVILSGTITNASLEAVALQGATLSNVTLTRAYVYGGTIANGTIYNSILVNVTSATGTYINNTTVNTTLPNGAINTRALNATADDYTPPQGEADNGDAMSAAQREALGDTDYYGNPRVNNSSIDKGAVEYVWPPYIVTINVIGHGLVSPRGAVEVVRGASLTFTVTEDPKHQRGEAVVENAEKVSDGIYRVMPSADMTVMVTFPGLTVGPEGDYADINDAIAEAQDGETITVAPGTYDAIDVKGKRLKIVASSTNPYDTIIDAQNEKRAVKLADGAEIIGFTIQNGLSNEGAGVYGGTVRRSVIRWNKLTYNGFGAGVCDTFAESCLIVDNGSTSVERSNGGGAANSDLLNCTVVRNVADKGAGLYDCTAKNAVIALNVDLTGASSDWTGDSVEPDPSDCCTPTSGGIAVDATKLFVDAANDDWRLQEGVACVNAGAADERLSALDVTGAPRIYGEAVDMGALEWNAPDRKVKISLQGRGIATVSYTKDSVATTEEVMWGNTAVLSVPHGTDTLTLTWREDSSTTVSRSLAGVMADGVLIAGSTAAANCDFGWTLATRDTVNVDLVFVAEDLQVNTNDTLTAALASAIAGETIRVASGEYTTAITVGAGITVDGGKDATLAGGVTLAKGAVLKNLTVTTTGVVGPETGSATLQHCVVTEVNGTAVERNVIVKICLIHNNTGSGLQNATAYLSTIAANQGEGVTGASKVYGSIVWGNSTDVTSSVAVVDSYVGGNPRFILPAPDGDNYALMTSSPAIDVAKMAQWDGFTDADRALTDLAGNPRPRLTGFDAGAYELQTDATMDTLWTWYGTDYTMDGTVSGAYWRQMAYGAPRSVPAGEDARITDRAGYTSATLKVDGDSSFGNVAFLNANADLRIEDAGGTWTIASLANKSTASALTIDAKLYVGSAFYQNGGSLTLEPNADFTLGGHFSAVNIPVKQTGGAFTVASGNTDMMGSSTYLLSDGLFNFGIYLNLRDSSVVTVSGGELSGEEISIAQTGGTSLVISGGAVNVTRIETGDTAGGRWGDIVQTGGTVIITGSGSGKQAPLHISHWSGNSTYTLRGGELNVPNGEVRLGNDGNGTLRLEGGVAKLNTVSISNGKFQLAGGTVEAATPAGAFTAEAVEGTTSTIVAYPEDNTGLALNLTGSGTVNLAQGKYTSATTITGQHIMMVAGTKLHASVDHSNGRVLTLEGNPSNYIEIYGTYKPGQLAFSSLPPLNEDKYVLFIHQTGSERFETVEVAEPWKSCCTVTVENYAMYTAIKVNRYAEPTTVGGVTGSTTPTITVDGNTTWSDATKWSVPFVQDGAAIVNAVSSGTLHIDSSSQVKMSTLTFNVPEGVTLNVTATTMPDARIVKKTGLGTLKWSTKINYGTFDEGEGSFIAAASGQGFGGKAFETMTFRAEANTTLSGQSRIHVTVVEGVTLGLDTASVLDGSITMEHTDWSGNGTVQAKKSITFVGDFTTQQYAMTRLEGSLTLAGKTTLRYGNFYTDGNVRIGGNVTVVGLPGNGVFNYLSQGLKTFNVGSNDVTLGDKVQVLNNQWPDGAMKIGSGTLTFPKGYTLGGTATFSGPVVFSESLTTTGALHFKSDAVVTIPYGCTLTAADEIRVEPGARFIITPPQDNVTEGATVPLLVSTKTAGLRVDQLATVAVAWATAPSDSAISNPIASLNGDTLQYTVTLSTVKTWTGADSSDWSTSGNWSGTGDVAYFTRSPSQKTVTLSQSVEPSRITIRSGAYTFTDGANGYAFEGKPDVTQYADSDEEPGATWQTFFSRGSYMLHARATAKLALNDWTYNGSFMGSGNIIVSEGRFALGAASTAFVGNMTVESGATLRLCNAAALYNASVTVKGTLAVETSTSVASVVSDAGTLLMSKDAPLEVRQSLTGNTLSIQVTDITEVGDWTLLTYPATTSTTFELVDATRGAYLVAALKRTETALMLVVRSSEDIEWTGTKTVDGVTTDAWKVNGAAVDVMDPTQKNLFFNDVEGVATASVALPAEPRSLTVTAQTTRYTLSGTLTNAPITVANGAEVTLATTSAKPTSVSNEGVVIVTGTLDLTQASLAGFGRYIVGAGGVIRVGAQALAESTATFVRNGGQIIVVTEGDFSLPENRIPTENGTFVKEGDGTLYVAPAALTQPVEVHAGTLAPTGAMALKARYFKFEALERFNTSLGNNIATSLADFTMMLNGQKLMWPNNTADAFVRFDSGSTHTILIGIENDEQKHVSATGELIDLLDHNPSTELIWGEWHAFYCAGGAHQRTYFVIDAGEDGLLFTGYNVAVPSSLLSFFKKWTVAAANEISDWRPSLQASTVTENENQVWQSLDERTLTQPMEALTPRTWLTPSGYSARRASGFWSKFSAPITLNAGTTLDLTKTIGTSGILQDQVEMASVAGEGSTTLIMPASLQVTADAITVDTLKLVGSTALKKPITATTMTFKTLVVSDSVAEVFNRGSQVRYVVAEGYTGTTVPTLVGMTPPADGGSWSLKQSGTTLILELVGSQRELYATLTESENVWGDLAWCDGLGTEVKNINWTKVQKVTLQLSDASPDMVTLSLPSTLTFTSLTVDYGQTQDKALALEGEGSLAVETLILSGDNRSAFLPRSKTVMACDNLEIRLPKWDISVPFLECIGGDDTYTPPALELGLWANGEETLRTKLLGSNAIALRSGTLVLTREEQFGSMTRTFRVDAGATLDVKGCPISNNIILNGGTLANTGNAIGTNKRQTYNISLTADSFVSGSSNFYSLANGYNAHTLTLNGHTLTKRGSNTFSLYNGDVDGGNGTIVCESGTFKVEPNNAQIRILKNVAFIPKGGAITLAGAYTLEGMVKMDAGVVCSNNITLATNAILAGCPRIDGNLTLGAGAILEVTNAATPLEVRGTISSTVTMRLADALALGKTSLPILFLPNVAETSSTTVNLSNLPTGAELEWGDKVLYLVPEGIDASVREVMATISGDANWSALTWTDMNGTSVTPDWRFVTAVTLTLTADATLTRDVATLALTSFTLADTAHTLTLEGAALPSTLTTLAANTSIIFGSGVLSTIPTNLSGAKNLTFKSSVTSTNSGGDTFAYNNFTGNWFVESGATLTLAGDGGKMGVLNTTGDNSGIITVKNGATIALNGGHVFGWADTSKQSTRTVLVVDGGTVDVSLTKEQYLRRTFEFKNGATLNAPGLTLYHSRGGNVKITEGEVTFKGYYLLNCDSNGGTTPARWIVSEGARLNVPAVVRNSNNNINFSLVLSGGGTIVTSGYNLYSLNPTEVEANTTLLVNGTHRYGKPYIIRQGASFGGTGTLEAVSDNGCSVTFEAGASLVVVDKADPLTLQIGANGSITFPEGGVMVTPPEGITVGNPAKLLKVNKPMTTANLTLTNSEDYALEVIQEGDWYTAICTKATLVTELRATAGQSFSDIFDPDTSVLAPNATLTIDFENVVEGGTATPGTFTFDNATPISFASITVQGSNGGTLLKTGTGTVTSSATTAMDTQLTVPASVASLGAVMINEGATLTVADTTTISTVSGTGTLVCNGFLPSEITTSLTANTWRGTVKIVDYAGSGSQGATQLKLYDYGHENSVVEVENVTGWIASGSTIHNLKLTGAGLTFNNGSSTTDATITINHLFGSGSFNGATGNTWDYIVNIMQLTNAEGTETFEGAFDLSSDNSADVAVVIGENATAENGKILVAGTAAIKSEQRWSAKNGITVKTTATMGGEGTLGSAVTFENGATLDLAKGTLTATNTVTFGAPLKVTVGNGVELNGLVVLKKADDSITEPVIIENVKVAVNGGDVTYSLMQTSEGYALSTITTVTELTATAGQSLSDIFDSATSVLAPEATLVINFGDVVGETSTPGIFTFDNAGAVSFASITVQGSNGGTLLKTGTGAVTCTTFTRETACTDLTLDVSLFSAAYTGNQTIDGWSLGLYVPAEATPTLTNVFTVNAGATLKKVGEGTLTLSSQNIFNDNSALQILEGALHLNAKKESISGDILVATGATLKLIRNEDLINFRATNVIDIYGTLDLDSTRWTLQGGNTLNLYPGAQVIGLGQHHDNANGYYGALDWAASGAIHVKANNSETGTATISANLRMRAEVTVEVEAGMTAVFTGTIYKGNTGKTLTKTGEGTMQYDFTVNPNSVSVTAGTLAGAGVVGNTLTMATGTTLALPAEGTLSVAGAVSFGATLNIAVAENVELADKLIVTKADDTITEATFVNTRITVNGTNEDYYLVQTNMGYILKTKEVVTTLSATAGQSLSQLITATQKIGTNPTLTIDFGDVVDETATPGTFVFDNATDITFASITIMGSNGGALAKTGAGAVTATATAVTNTQVTIPAETAVLGAVSIAEDAKVIVADTITVTSVMGEGTLELQAAEADVNYGIVKGGDFAGTAIVTASGENGTVIENTDKVTWPEGKQFIFNGGTHALTFYPGELAQGKQDETEETASIQVKSNTTLTLKARDFSGWYGFHAGMALSVKGENAKVIAAPFGNDPGCFTGRVFLADGATIQGGDTNTAAINFYGNENDANIRVTSGTATWTNKLWIGASDKGGADIAQLGITVDEGATFDLQALVQNNRGLKKTGAGLMTISGTNTSTGALAVNSGPLAITGTWAGATTVAAAGTLSGTGTIGGALTFTEGAILVVDPNATSPLRVTGAISGTAQLSFMGEVVQRTAVIASAQAIQTSSFVPPAGYNFAVETIDGVNTLYVTPAPITELTATLSGEMAWDEIDWKTPQGATVDISTISVAQVANITFNLAADTKLTFVDDLVTRFPALNQVYVGSALSSDVAFTVRGNTVVLPSVKVSVRNAPMTFRSEATSLTVATFNPLIEVDYGLGIDVAFLNACTLSDLPTTYRLFGDGVVQKTLSGGVRIAQGKVTVGNELSSVTALSIESGATLKVTTKAALTNFLTSNQLALGSTALAGAGALELAFADAKTILEMTGTGGNFSGDILVTSGTLKFPNGGQNGPGKNRVITVTGANAALATGTKNDATGWNVDGRQRIVLKEQGEFKVYKRDTFKTPITMVGGIIRLMETAEDSGRGLDWFNSPKLTVNALEAASVASPTDSYITYVDGAAGATIKMNIRDGSFPVEVNEKARLTVDVNLYGGELTKTGVGELVLTNAENSYGATTINAGTLTVTGATGTGATTMAVGTTLRGTGTVKGDLTFTNTTETVEEVTTITGWPTFEVDVTTGAAPLTVTGSITGVAKLAFTGDIASLASIPVVISTQESVVDSFEGIPDGFTFTKVGNMHILVNENAQEYTALYAKVAGDTKWSQLTWTTDAEGTENVTMPIAWDLVESVTLTAEANATVTRDVSTTSMSSLTVVDSEYTLTLAGYALPETSTLVVDGALCLSEGVVTTMPNLRGAGTQTFMGGEIISRLAGNAGTSYAYNDFTGRWILENGTTMRILGGGAQKGQLNWDSTVEGSGQIEVRQGARLVLEAQNVFGWGAVNELHQRKVLVVDGGEVEISTAENYIRRTIELKNGATLACPATNSTVYFSRGATIEVTEGEATISGMLNISCDNAGSSVGKGATIRVDEGATLNLPVSIAYGKNGNTFALTYTGGGTVNITGENSYHTYTETIVDEGMTFIMNGTHIAPGENTLKPYTFKAGATLMGSGTINGAVAFNSGATVVADGQALTLGAVTSTATVVEVTAEAGASLADADDTVTVFTSTGVLDVAQYTVAPEYALDVVELPESAGYALVVKRASFVTLTGTNDFMAETQQALRDIVIDALNDAEVTTGEYAVEVEVYTKGSETPKMPTADEVDALLGCFINVETVEVENNTATVKIEYEFGLAGVTVDANLNVIFTATVEGPTVGTADYVDGVSFVITDEGTQESWTIDAENIDFNAPVGSVYLTLPDTYYEVGGQQKSVLTNFIGTRQFKVKVRK